MKYIKLFATLLLVMILIAFISISEDLWVELSNFSVTVENGSSSESNGSSDTGSSSGGNNSGNVAPEYPNEPDVPDVPEINSRSEMLVSYGFECECGMHFLDAEIANCESVTYLLGDWEIYPYSGKFAYNITCKTCGALCDKYIFISEDAMWT